MSLCDVVSVDSRTASGPTRPRVGHRRRSPTRCARCRIPAYCECSRKSAGDGRRRLGTWRRRSPPTNRRSRRPERRPYRPSILYRACRSAGYRARVISHVRVGPALKPDRSAPDASHGQLGRSSGWNRRRVRSWSESTARVAGTTTSPRAISSSVSGSTMVLASSDTDAGSAVSSTWGRSAGRSWHCSSQRRSPPSSGGLPPSSPSPERTPHSERTSSRSSSANSRTTTFSTANFSGFKLRGTDDPSFRWHSAPAATSGARHLSGPRPQQAGGSRSRWPAVRHDPYLVLGISRAATHLEVGAAHARMALVFAPDRWAEATPELVRQAGDWLRIVHEAIESIVAERSSDRIEGGRLATERAVPPAGPRRAVPGFARHDEERRSARVGDASRLQTVGSRRACVEPARCAPVRPTEVRQALRNPTAAAPHAASRRDVTGQDLESRDGDSNPGPAHYE